MKKPHKHAELIKLWADGAEVQWFSESNKEWFDYYHGSAGPGWSESHLYRIKPEPKPDMVYYACISRFRCGDDDLKLVFDGETGKLKETIVL